MDRHLFLWVKFWLHQRLLKSHQHIVLQSNRRVFTFLRLIEWLVSFGLRMQTLRRCININNCSRKNVLRCKLIYLRSRFWVQYKKGLVRKGCFYITCTLTCDKISIQEAQTDVQSLCLEFHNDCSDFQGFLFDRNFRDKTMDRILSVFREYRCDLWFLFQDNCSTIDHNFSFFSVHEPHIHLHLKCCYQLLTFSHS